MPRSSSASANVSSEPVNAPVNEPEPVNDRPNAIVQWMLDMGQRGQWFDESAITAPEKFSTEDLVQLAHLLGWPTSRLTDPQARKGKPGPKPTRGAVYKQLYDQGYSTAEIATKFGISTSAVNGAVKGMEIVRPPKKTHRLPEYLRLLETGVTVPEIAQTCGVPEKNVKRTLLGQKLKLKLVTSAPKVSLRKQIARKAEPRKAELAATPATPAAEAKIAADIAAEIAAHITAEAEAAAKIAAEAEAAAKIAVEAAAKIAAAAETAAEVAETAKRQKEERRKQKAAEVANREAAAEREAAIVAAAERKAAERKAEEDEEEEKKKKPELTELKKQQLQAERATHKANLERRMLEKQEREARLEAERLQRKAKIEAKDERQRPQKKAVIGLPTPIFSATFPFPPTHRERAFREAPDETDD